MKQNNMA